MIVNYFWKINQVAHCPVNVYELWHSSAVTIAVLILSCFDMIGYLYFFWIKNDNDLLLLVSFQTLFLGDFFFLLWYQENLTQLGEAKAKFCHESTRFRCSFLELKVLDCFCFTISHWCAGQYYYSAVLVGHLLISSFIYSLFSILGLL
jgi:hypothetical protein